MPAEQILLPLLGMGMQAGTGVYQAKQAEQYNKENLEFQKNLLNSQRMWALQDWDRVNAYNHPAQQMTRYKEAGLNPQLIYGNANNSPSAMLRSVTAEAPKNEPRGILEGIGNVGAGINSGINNYFAQAQLENETRKTDASILAMKAQSDRTNQEIQLTKERWEELVMMPTWERLNKQADIMYKDVKRNIEPTRAMAWKKYMSETAKTDANAKHAISLFELAEKEGKLKQADVELLEKIASGPQGVRLGIEVLKLILGR